MVIFELSNQVQTLFFNGVTNQRKLSFLSSKFPRTLAQKQCPGYIFLSTVEMKQSKNLKCLKIQSAGDRCSLTQLFMAGRQAERLGAGVAKLQKWYHNSISSCWFWSILMTPHSTVILGCKRAMRLRWPDAMNQFKPALII